ncbi:MFS transporter [Nocardia sp. NPDC127526]|uniref:MFS transporter n=1 Tax=Nocardia sp. NPDC127526 TaxID=3345393 RepID=UPI00362CD479
MPLLPSTLLRRPRVLAIWMAQLLSVTGDRFFAMAVMWLALERSGPVTMGLVAIAESVPYIAVGAFGHRLLSRCVSFRALAGVDAARAVLTAALPLAWSAGGTPAMLTVVAVLGVLGAVFDPSLGALVPELVSESDRPALMGLMDLTGRIARIAGPALAGVVVAFAPFGVLFAADAATFAISTAALLLLARATRLTSSVSRACGSEPRLARRLLRQEPDLRTAFSVQGVGVFLNALPGIGLPVLLVHSFGAGPTLYGSVMTASGIAALVGNRTMARARPGRFPTRFCLAWAASGILLIAIGAAGSLAWVVVVATAIGFVNPIISISLSVHIAAFEPAERLRLLAVNYLVMRSAGTAGLAVIPAAIASAPTRGFICGGIVLALAGTIGALKGASSRRRPVGVRVVESVGTTVSTTRSS